MLNSEEMNIYLLKWETIQGYSDILHFFYFYYFHDNSVGIGLPSHSFFTLPPFSPKLSQW